ncbi:hypothetical protein IE81DRAFT_72875 [Ceraceosorus guamensis]|uniref:Uncharacterized protein n=1 Tax=Ceraceosorus guamensis TaxID=1522189 RepID=A0A316W6F8_9BASI|nr:hypothetical protein IE81DRAFT_72875 [Ceraceosorus guamensis]PWN43633.1 hypothetical protein IE81DRAFT_72875 [Ceraceosorus guamensis]
MVGASAFAVGKVSYVVAPPNDGTISRVDMIVHCITDSSATVNIKDIQFAYTDRTGKPVDGSVAPLATVARKEQHENLLGAGAGFENGGGGWYRSGNPARVSFIQTPLARSGGWAARMISQPSGDSGDDSSIGLDIAGNPPSGTLPYAAWIWYRVTDKKDKPASACGRTCRPRDYQCNIELCVVSTTGELATMNGNLCQYYTFNSAQYNRYELLNIGPASLIGSDPPPPAAPNQMGVAFSCGKGVESATILFDNARLQYEGSGAETIRPTTPATSSSSTNLIKNPFFTTSDNWVTLSSNGAGVQPSPDGGHAYFSGYNNGGVPEVTQYVSGLVGGATYKLVTKCDIQSFDATNAINSGGLTDPGCFFKAMGLNQQIAATEKYFAANNQNGQLELSGTYVHNSKLDPLPLNYQMLCDKSGNRRSPVSRVNLYSVSLTRIA